MLDDKLDIIYMRLSKEDGDVTAGTENESCSIHSQRHCIWRYIRDHPDLDGNYEELVDDGYTGTNFNRPGMVRLLKMVEAGLVLGSRPYLGICIPGFPSSFHFD